MKFSKPFRERGFYWCSSVFIRLQGCPVGCSWCDTKQTWEKEQDKESTLGDIALKTIDSDAWAMADGEALVQLMKEKHFSAQHIVITGGEPCIYDLQPLTGILEQYGYQCQIETTAHTLFNALITHGLLYHQKSV